MLETEKKQLAILYKRTFYINFWADIGNVQVQASEDKQHPNNNN